MVGREPRFVEYNAESPAGIGFTDSLSEIFLDLPGMRRWDHTARLDRFHGRRHLFETLLWAFHQWGGAGMPTIAVIDWENVMTRRDFELCAEYFRDQGAATVICDPRRLEYRGGRLWLGNRAISLVYRRVLLHELLERADEAHGLLQAYRDGAVCMVNSPRSKLLHKKSMFALLTDRQLGLALTEEEEDVINATVPWTRIAAEGPTTYGGRRVDLVQFVLAEQERLVLKPFDDYGGKGVVLGWEVTPEEWRGALEAAVNSRYVVQERVPIPCAEFPFWQGGGPSGGSGSVAVAPLLLDTDPLLFRGRLGSVLTRISGSALLNVSAGTGSTTPTFVVEERG
jgi:hypothetical protein